LKRKYSGELLVGLNTTKIHTPTAITLLLMQLLKFILAAALAVIGMYCIAYPFRKQSQQEKLQGKHALRMTGKGGRIHYCYIGCVLLICAIALVISD
jgi:hypothetical protein